MKWKLTISLLVALLAQVLDVDAQTCAMGTYLSGGACVIVPAG
jgi:hypothetical protein